MLSEIPLRDNYEHFECLWTGYSCFLKISRELILWNFTLQETNGTHNLNNLCQKQFKEKES